MPGRAAGARFSVVLNTFNRAAVLPRSIDSVLAQSCKDFELIVVDDGSTDDTRQVVAEHLADPVRYVHRSNGGLAAARNTGLGAATGDCAAFLDDDDRVEAGWLSALRSPHRPGPGRGGVLRARLVDPQGRTIETRLPSPLGPSFSNQTGLFLAGTFVVRRDVLEAVGGYTEGLRCSEQTDLALCVLPHCVEHGLRISAVDEANLV